MPAPRERVKYSRVAAKDDNNLYPLSSSSVEAR